MATRDALAALSKDVLEDIVRGVQILREGGGTDVYVLGSVAE